MVRCCLLALFVMWVQVMSVRAYGMVVLQYHHVADNTPRLTSISPAQFAEHMMHIEQTGMRVVSIVDLKKWLQKGERVPDNTVVITFDDGYRSVYDNAFPLLKKRGWPFAVFVNTKAHDQKTPHYMSWEQLRTLSQSGGTVLNHTDSHPHLVRQQGYENYRQWQSRRLQEILYAEQRISKEIGQSHKMFAYPYGEHDADLRAELKKQGFLAFGQQSGPVPKDVDLQRIPRFPFGGVYGGMEDFSLKVHSLPFPQARIKVTDETGRVLNDPELPQDVARPELRIASPLMPYIDGAACYASGQGRISSSVRGGTLVAKAGRDLPPGRSRYNCTARAGKGRFYWYSRMFIRRNADGSWVDE